MSNILTASVLAVAVVGGSYLALDHVAPAWTAEVRTWFNDSASDWSDEAKRADPVGYLQFSEKQLATQKAQLQTVTQKIRASVHPLEEHINQTHEELAKTEALLREGRSVYQQAETVQTSDTITGIKFAGRTYPDMATFKAQLEVLYQEQQGKQTLLKKAEATRTQLNTRHATTALQLGRVEMAINEIGPKIAIVQAATAGNELDKIITELDQVTEVALNSQAQLAEDYNLIGTTRELLETSAKGQFQPVDGFDAEFENFLQTKE